jgi:hypothetical protein
MECCIKKQEQQKATNKVINLKPYQPFELNDELKQTLEKVASHLIEEKVPKYQIGEQDGQKIYAVAEDPKGKNHLYLLGYFHTDYGDILIAGK